MVFVLVSWSLELVPDELVTLMSWDSRDFLIFLVMVEWKDAVKDGVVAFSFLLNCLRVSLLGFSSFCLTLSNVHDAFDSVRGVHFVRGLCRLCPVQGTSQPPPPVSSSGYFMPKGGGHCPPWKSLEKCVCETLRITFSKKNHLRRDNFYFIHAKTSKNYFCQSSEC